MPLECNAKVRVWHRAQAMNRRTEVGKHYGLVIAKALDVLKALLWGFQWSAHDLSKIARQAKMSVLSAVCATFVCGRNRRKRQPNQAALLSKRCFKMHPKCSGISNRRLACDFEQIVRRPLLQRPGRTCPLSDRGTRKPPFRFRPRRAVGRVSDLRVELPETGRPQNHPTQPFVPAPMNDCSGETGPLV